MSLARWRSRDALRPAAMSEFPIRQVLKRKFPTRNAFTSDARQVERKIKRAPFSPSALLRSYVEFVASPCGFRDKSQRVCIYARSKRIKSSFITSPLESKFFFFLGIAWDEDRTLFKDFRKYVHLSILLLAI